MKFTTIYTLTTCLLAVDALSITKRPTVEDAAANARTLINRESLANINTIYQNGDSKGLPASFVEYYTDCGDGNPVMLAINMATSFKNIAEGSQYSLTVRVGDHAPHEQVSPKYPGGRPYSVAGSPRLNLRGQFRDLSEDEVDAVKECFLQRHKDAVWWLPGNKIHESHFVKFMVDDVYFLGGFGDTAYIGNVPSELYHKAKVIENDDSEEEIEEITESTWGYDVYKTGKTLQETVKHYFQQIETQASSLRSFFSLSQEEQPIVEEIKLNVDDLKVRRPKNVIFKGDLEEQFKELTSA